MECGRNAISDRNENVIFFGPLVCIYIGKNRILLTPRVIGEIKGRVKRTWSEFAGSIQRVCISRPRAYMQIRTCRARNASWTALGSVGDPLHQGGRQWGCRCDPAQGNLRFRSVLAASLLSSSSSLTLPVVAAAACVQYRSLRNRPIKTVKVTRVSPLWNRCHRLSDALYYTQYTHIHTHRAAKCIRVRVYTTWQTARSLPYDDRHRFSFLRLSLSLCLSFSFSLCRTHCIGRSVVAAFSVVLTIILYTLHNIIIRARRTFRPLPFVIVQWLPKYRRTRV